MFWPVVIFISQSAFLLILLAYPLFFLRGRKYSFAILSTAAFVAGWFLYLNRSIPFIAIVGSGLLETFTSLVDARATYFVLAGFVLLFFALIIDLLFFSLKRITESLFYTLHFFFSVLYFMCFAGIAVFL